MDEENLLLVPEMPDDRWQVGGHQGEVPLAQCDPIAGAGYEVEEPLEVVDAAHDPPHSADWRQGWVVGVDSQADPGALCHGHDSSEEILQRLPEFFLADGTELARG